MLWGLIEDLNIKYTILGYIISVQKHKDENWNIKPSTMFFLFFLNVGKTVIFSEKVSVQMAAIHELIYWKKSLSWEKVLQEVQASLLTDTSRLYFQRWWQTSILSVGRISVLITTVLKILLPRVFHFIFSNKKKKAAAEYVHNHIGINTQKTIFLDT